MYILSVMCQLFIFSFSSIFFLGGVGGGVVSLFFLLSVHFSYFCIVSSSVYLHVCHKFLKSLFLYYFKSESQKLREITFIYFELQ